MKSYQSNSAKFAYREKDNIASEANRISILFLTLQIHVKQPID